MILGHTDLRKDVPGAKLDAESDFEVRLAVAPRKPCQIPEKLIFPSNAFVDIFLIGRRNIKCRESSETRFPKFWWLYEPNLKSEQPFKVYRRRRRSGIHRLHERLYFFAYERICSRPR